MKFIKGIIVGSMITAGTTILCSETMLGKTKPMKKVKKIIRKAGFKFA